MSRFNSPYNKELNDKIGDLSANLADKAPRTELIDNFNRLTKTINKMFSLQTTKIVAFGDSLTWGYKANVGSQVTGNYPSLLQYKLRKIYDNNNITIVNKGVGGNTTAMALARLDADVIAQSPDLTIVMFGINDANSANNVSPTTYKDNLVSIVKKIQAAGSEVLLLSPTPIVKTDLDRARSLQTYSRIAQEVARKYNLAFIDMFSEISELFFNKQEVPYLMFPDLVHFEDTKYKYISDIVTAKALDFHNQSNVLTINSLKETFIPLVGSPFVDTDITNITTASFQFSQQHYTLQSDSAGGTKLRIQMYVGVSGLDLILVNPHTSAGGKISVLDNGTAIKTVDCFGSSSDAYDSEDILIENIPIGYHVIEFLSSNITLGQATGVGKIYLSAIALKPTKTKVSDKLFKAYGSNGSLEKFKRINDGIVRYTGVANPSGALLLGNTNAELKVGKILVIEAEGKFFGGSGIVWFGNKSSNTQGVLQGYTLYLGGSAVILYNGDPSGLGVNIGSLATTLDFSVPHKIRITHTVDGVITVFVDGTQLVQVTNTKERNGWFGVFSQVVGTMEVTRLEYTYI